MGAAGDMLTASLIELFDNREGIVEELNSIGIPNVEYIAEQSDKCGIKGTHVRVLVSGEEEHDHHHHDEHHHHHHSSMNDIKHIIEHLNIEERIKKNAIAIYMLIAEAESHVHGVDVSEIHFHEVGTIDAIADVVAVSYLIDKLKLDSITTSPIHVGSGSVHCAHGILPVPAPATAYILKDIPIYSTELKGELCTPTGAALLKYYSSSFGSMSAMRISRIGYGMGTKDFDRANCIRALLEECDDEYSDEVVELECQVDDMTGEEVGFFIDRIFALGALDAYWSSIGMKKNRPGILLTVLSSVADKDKIVKGIFKYTTTIGIRESRKARYILKRELVDRDGIRYKRSSGYGVSRVKAEYDDVAKKAIENECSLSEARKDICPLD